MRQTYYYLSYLSAMSMALMYYSSAVCLDLAMGLALSIYFSKHGNPSLATLTPWFARRMCSLSQKEAQLS